MTHGFKIHMHEGKPRILDRGCLVDASLAPRLREAAIRDAAPQLVAALQRLLVDTRQAARDQALAALDAALGDE